MRPLDYLAGLALVGAVLCLVALVLAAFRIVPLAPVTVLAGFLLCFGVGKAAVALRRPHADEVEPAHASPMLRRLWIGYKLVAAAVAIAGAIYLWQRGPQALDRMLGEPAPAPATPR